MTSEQQTQLRQKFLRESNQDLTHALMLDPYWDPRHPLSLDSVIVVTPSSAEPFTVTKRRPSRNSNYGNKA
jgi:hypothetical protein